MKQKKRTFMRMQSNYRDMRQLRLRDVTKPSSRVVNVWKMQRRAFGGVTTRGSFLWISRIMPPRAAPRPQWRHFFRQSLSFGRSQTQKWKSRAVLLRPTTTTTACSPTISGTRDTQAARATLYLGPIYRNIHEGNAVESNWKRLYVKLC